ncbi:MAG TPA: alkaline phosphatase family protein [Candidatus Bathyarchaeia archaeon]|nr:alkaline phosphatase family protein [Candidatus Bathyarchaeia archaeon]
MKLRAAQRIVSVSVFVILSTVGAFALLPVSRVHAPPTGSYFDNVVTILMENNGYCDIVTSAGPPGSCANGAGSYETRLSANYSIAGNCQSDSICSTGGYTATSHNSEGNYITMVGGYDYGHTGDGYCCWGIPSTDPNIVDRLEGAGLTWAAWAEDATGSGTCSFNPGNGIGLPRNADHFGFKTFSDMDTTARCANFLTTASGLTSSTCPSSPTASDTAFTSSLTASAPNYIWLTPNDCDNGHDPGAAFGDTYLSKLVPKILTSTLFTTKRAALFIVYDEGNAGCGPAPCENTSSTPDYIYASWSGPVAKTHFVGATAYSHRAYTATIDQNWSLSCLVTGYDCSAPVMSEFFTNPPSPNFSLSSSPTSVTTQLNQAGTSTITVTPSGGFTGTVSFTTSITPTTGLTCQSMASVSGGSGSSTLSCTGTTAQSYTVTVTGTSGSLSHQINVPYTVTSSNGNFGTCTSLPQGWNCGNTNGLSGSYANIVNGVLQTRQLSQGVGSDSSYYYATSQKGTFPWSPCQAPANGVLLTGLTVVNTTFMPTVFQPYGTYRYHIAIALYYYLPNGPVTSQGHTHQCLDTQSRVENINGLFSVVGTTASYDAGDSFGYDRVSLGAVAIGQTYTLSANVANQCQQDLAAWSIPTNTPCQLSGVEIGIEGFQFTELDVNFQSYAFITSAPAFDYSLSSSGGITVQQASSGRNTVTATLTGGTSQSVTLSCVTSTLPTGASCSFNPATVTPTASITSTVSTTSSTPTGTYQVQVTGSPLGATTTPATFTLTVLAPKYTLTLQGFDYDGGLEETLTLNGHQLTQLPAVDSPQNAGVYVSFTVDMTSLVVHGANTLVFTHANWDCGVADNTKNVQITDAAGNIIFSDPTERLLSCTQSITYQFNA